MLEICIYEYAVSIIFFLILAFIVYNEPFSQSIEVDYKWTLLYLLGIIRRRTFIKGIIPIFVVSGCNAPIE